MPESVQSKTQGWSPDPFHALHPLRYPLAPPFSPQQIVSEGAGPSRTYFQKPARSLRSLSRKKFLTGAPAASPRRFHPMRKKGGKKNGSTTKSPWPPAWPQSRARKPRHKGCESCPPQRAAATGSQEEQFLKDDKQVLIAWLKRGHFYRGKDGDISKEA